MANVRASQDLGTKGAQNAKDTGTKGGREGGGGDIGREGRREVEGREGG